jgi:hypothetical protein
LERVKGIEPSYEAWEAAVLPLNYTRGLLFDYRQAPWRKGLATMRAR